MSEEQDAQQSSAAAPAVTNEALAAPPSSSGRMEHERCTPYFDALWFCYSPVYQMNQYYIYGTVDDCTGHWRELYNCLKKRTKFKEQVPEDPMKNKHPLWELRTKEEAEAFWKEEFGHLSGDNGQQAAAEGRQGSKTTLV